MITISKRLLLLITIVVMIMQPVVASIPDTAMASYITTSDVVINTPYLDFSTWIFITLLGFFFLILSNFAQPDQAPKLWAIIAPLFIGPSAYFALMLRRVTVGMHMTSTEMHINAVNTIMHPEWLCFILSVILVLSLINLWMQLSNKPMEKTKKEEVLGSGGF